MDGKFIWEKYSIAAAMIGLACFFANEATAQVITTCGASTGRGYYLAGGAVPEKEAGWRDDRISGGGIILVAKGKEPQLLIMDAQKKLMDAESDMGGKLIWTQSERNDLWSVLVAYSGVIETYLFQLDQKGDGQLVWTTTKATALIAKASIFHAECRGTAR